MHPAPTRARRGIALLVDNLMLSYIAYFGDAFAAYIAFYFLTTVGWGLRFGRHYLFLTTAIAVAGMSYNLAFSEYWRANQMFGAVIIIAMLANTINVSILLRAHRLGQPPAGGEDRGGVAPRLAGSAHQAAQPALLPRAAVADRRLGRPHAAAHRADPVRHRRLQVGERHPRPRGRRPAAAGDQPLRRRAHPPGRHLRPPGRRRVRGDHGFAARGRRRALVAETILRTIAEIDLFAAQGLRIGASVGVACGAGRREIPDLLKLADSAMYEAKRAGKGCYRFAGRT